MLLLITGIADAAAISVTPYKLLPVTLLSLTLVTSSANAGYAVAMCPKDPVIPGASSELRLDKLLTVLCFDTKLETDCWLRCSPRLAVVNGA